MRLACVSLSLCALGVVPAAEPVAFTRLQEDLRATDDARSRQGAEVAAWRAEDERLALTLEGLRAQLARVQAQVTAGEAKRDGLRQEHERLTNGEAVAALKVLVETARAGREKLRTAAAALPPGTLVVPTEDTPEALLKALELSTRAVDQAVVTIAAGHRAGDPPATRTAVRLLRVAGLAWWVSLDGREAGTATQREGNLELEPATPLAQAEIRRAVSMAEGRTAAEPLALPRGAVRPPAQATPGAAP
jgi:hypothetical protein